MEETISTPGTQLNVINSGSLQSLKAGETLLYRIEKCKNDGYQAHFAEIKDKGNRSSNLLARMNRSNPSFQRKPQRLWQLIHPDDFLEDFGIDVRDEDGWTIDTNERTGKETWVKELNVLNPAFLQSAERVRVEIMEYNEPTQQDIDYGEENLRKRIPNKAGGFDYPLSEGKFIYQFKQLVLNEPTDSYCEVDVTPTSIKATQTVTEEAVNVTQ